MFSAVFTHMNLDTSLISRWASFAKLSIRYETIEARTVYLFCYRGRLSLVGDMHDRRFANES